MKNSKYEDLKLDNSDVYGTFDSEEGCDVFLGSIDLPEEASASKGTMPLELEICGYYYKLVD